MFVQYSGPISKVVGVTIVSFKITIRACRMLHQISNFVDRLTLKQKKHSIMFAKVWSHELLNRKKIGLQSSVTLKFKVKT